MISRENLLAEQLREKTLEIERLNNIIKQQDTRNSRQRIANRKLQEKNRKTRNIIKEVREKIENTIINCDGVAENLIDDIYEMLDKEK